MASMTGSDLDVLVVERESWEHGPPHELFKRLRGECPVHWSHCVPAYEDEAGYWSLTKADDIHAVSRDWETSSSGRDGITMVTRLCPVELIRAMFIVMDPPKHDRLKALF